MSLKTSQPELPQQREDHLLSRSGAAVRHPWHPWSTATRALLGHLETVGFSYSPRLVGSDDGHDLLSYIPGRSGAHGWAPAADERGLIAGARLLRAYHDAVMDWRADNDLVWFDGSRGTGGFGRIVCHGDFHPCNIVWDGLTPVGLPSASGGCAIPSHRIAAGGCPCSPRRMGYRPLTGWSST
jgi:hypothetical protein